MSPYLCGAAELDITPPVSLPMAGYSLGGPHAVGVMGHLFARALYIEDTAGEKVALCVVDLHAGTRYLLEKAVSVTGPSCGIGVDRLILCGTHTHTGPGNIYGNPLYDSFAQNARGLDKALADWLATRVADAVERAADARQPALIASAGTKLWGVTRNRSLEPFLNNLDPDAWHGPGAPGEGFPADLPEVRRKVDPRISVLAAFRESDRRPLAAFAFFGCHTTTIGDKAAYYSPDWAGYACRTAQWQLEQGSAGDRVVVAVGLSGAGDVNALHHDLTPPFPQSPSLARSVGSRVGHRIAEAVRAAEAEASEGNVAALYAEPTTEEGASYPVAEARLAGDWLLGAPMLAGSEDGRGLGAQLGLAWEGMTDPNTPEPQRPKAEAAGLLQDILRFLLDLDPGRVLPLHALRVGEHLFVTVPGEPTAHAAWDIEHAVCAPSGIEQVTVVGFAGDYFGYFPTPREYDLQHYEGASAIYGRYSAPHVSARLSDLLEAGVSGPLQPRPVEFESPIRRSRFAPPEELRCREVDPRPTIRRRASRVDLRWDMHWGDLVPFAAGWFVRLEVGEEAASAPFPYMGRDFDDVYAFIHVARQGNYISGTGTTHWHAHFTLPPEALDEESLGVRVSRCGDFPGFWIAIPEA